jgi:hypothetical protein
MKCGHIYMFIRLSAVIINYLENYSNSVQFVNYPECFELPNITGAWWNFYFVFRTLEISYVPVECIVKHDKDK